MSIITACAVCRNSLEDGNLTCTNCGTVHTVEGNFQWREASDPRRKERSALATQVGGQHYKSMKIQPIEFAVANKLDFFQKDVLKYVTRRKGDKAKRLEDLRKAEHYLHLYIEFIEKGEWE